MAPGTISISSCLGSYLKCIVSGPTSDNLNQQLLGGEPGCLWFSMPHRCSDTPLKGENHPCLVGQCWWRVPDGGWMWSIRASLHPTPTPRSYLRDAASEPNVLLKPPAQIHEGPLVKASWDGGRMRRSSCSCRRESLHVSSLLFCFLNLPPTYLEWSFSVFGFSLPSLYLDQFQILPRECPSFETDSPEVKKWAFESRINWFYNCGQATYLEHQFPYLPMRSEFYGILSPF